MQNSPVMHQGGPKDRMILESKVFPQLGGGLGFTRSLVDPFQEFLYRFAGYLDFAGWRRPIWGIQCISLNLFREKLAESLLVAEPFQAYRFSISCKDCADLAFRRRKALRHSPRRSF